ncbi:MAG: FtsX-like permease family protein [Chitinophagaceae bacterium]
MKGNILFKFSWRYFKAKKSTQAVNVISWVSMLAMLIGTASLVIILSAFNGFESLVKSLYASFYTDIRISAVEGKIMQVSSAQIEQLKKVDGVVAFSMSIEEKAVIQNETLQQVVAIKGVDEAYSQTSGLKEKIIRGNFNLGNADVPLLVMGIGVEQGLGIMADRTLLPLTVYLPKKVEKNSSIQPLDALSVANAYPRAVFSIQSDFDNKYVLTNIDFLRTFMHYAENELTYIEIKTLSGIKTDLIKKQISTIFGDQYKIEDRFEQNKTLYTTIRLEKLAIYGIFILMLIIAAFNMVGSLSMLVLEKQKDIQILKAMGAGNGLIQQIFLLEGIILSAIGSFGGILLALFLCYLQITFKLIPLEGASFLIDYYPVEWRIEDLITVAVTVTLIGVIASWMPSRRASLQKITLR